MGHITRAFVVLLVVGLLPIIAPPAAAAQDDAGTGADAGGTFQTAALVLPVGRHHGTLAPGDVDYFRFRIEAGASIDIDVDAGLLVGFLQVSDMPQRLGVTLYDPLGTPLDFPGSNIGDSRVTWPRALVSGEYRLAFDAAELGPRGYSFCFVVTGETCASHGLRAIATGTPLATRHAEVLLVPPVAANPGGSETPLDYLDAALDGIHRWDVALDAFATDHPQYAYLRELTAHVEVWDGTPERAGYDVIIVWSPYTGPIFRGLAADYTGGGALRLLCPPSATCSIRHALEPVVHDGTRLIIMSSFAAAPRAGQVLPDFPEHVDVYNVMMHEFAHTWGLGHTTTWTATYGPDLMNSPYPEVFGDGDPLGDGGERTAADCISNLDILGMARMYEWVGRGVRWDQRVRVDSVSLPPGMAYKLYC